MATNKATERYLKSRYDKDMNSAKTNVEMLGYNAQNGLTSNGYEPGRKKISREQGERDMRKTVTGNIGRQAASMQRQRNRAILQEGFKEAQKNKSNTVQMSKPIRKSGVSSERRMVEQKKRTIKPGGGKSRYTDR